MDKLVELNGFSDDEDYQKYQVEFKHIFKYDQ